MPMTALEELLSDVADYLELQLQANAEARREACELVDAGQVPRCVRPISRDVPGAAAIIAIEKSPE